MIERLKKLPWTLIAKVTAVVAAYILSSGPMRPFAISYYTTTSTEVLQDGMMATVAASHRGAGEWWHIVYAPVNWASEQPWGAPLESYLEMFPIRDEGELL